MSELHRVTGMFRDAGQARLAIDAARQKGMLPPDPDNLPQHASGVTVIIQTAGSVEDARHLLLAHGAYSAVISGPTGA
jgi:hypothetical protein